jgi:EAL domain-containing protein (putative c-di-GMP-specific phosphodiesterase class I)
MDATFSNLPDFSFAFQPIINVISGEIIAYEALVRGRDNQSAWSILEQVSPSYLQAFDQVLRLRAVRLAATLGIGCNINLNLMPSSLEESGNTIQATLDVAQQHNLSADRITMEITEQEMISDYTRFVHTIDAYRATGLKIAIDDFGAGYSGLNLLAEFQPDSIKLDMGLIRNIDTRGPRQAIVRGIIRTCTDLGIEIVAEGVETIGEYLWCREEGIEIFQGYLFARPGFEYFPLAVYPKLPHE